MTERMQAAALAMDAYEQHLLGDLANGHRTDHAEAEGLLHALVVDLVRYGEANRLDVVDLLDDLVQARIDRGGALVNPRYSFRLGTEVQFRSRRDGEHHRGFLTELRSPGLRQDAECVLRVPGIADPQHTTAAELEPATRMVPLSTRTAGTVFSAAAAEGTLLDLITGLRERQDGPGPDSRVLADLAELSTRLADWSGTTPERVLGHLRHLAGQAHLGEGSSAARRASAAFPDDIAAGLARERPGSAPSSRPARPDPGPRPRRM